MRLAVCESPPDMLPGSADWKLLAASVALLRPEIFLLNEMPFGPFIAAAPAYDREQFIASKRVHEQGLGLLVELGARHVIGTRPTLEGDQRLNQGFIWSLKTGAIAVHHKQFFPDETGFHEARWFDRGETHFRLGEAGNVLVGFLICTEVMFTEWARHYGRLGAHLIVVPRAARRESTPRWKIALQMAANASGCYVASSNRRGVDARGQAFGGYGWIMSPDGDVLAETSQADPVVSAEIDPALAERAKLEYPRYVQELEPRPRSSGPP